VIAKPSPRGRENRHEEGNWTAGRLRARGGGDVPACVGSGSALRRTGFDGDGVSRFSGGWCWSSLSGQRDQRGLFVNQSCGRGFSATALVNHAVFGRPYGFDLDGRAVTETFVELSWLNQATHSTTASSSCERVCQTRSLISSVLNVSTNDSASALAGAVNCAQSVR
jgi:hypothetical protein